MTADKAALLALRDRLKAATGPDRDLDTALANFCEFTANGVAIPAYPACWDNFSSPRLTGSLDAAVGLVPEGAWKEITGPRKSINIPSPSPNFWHCEISTWDPAVCIGHGWGATEPLAIIDALLAHEIAKATS